MRTEQCTGGKANDLPYPHIHSIPCSNEHAGDYCDSGCPCGHAENGTVEKMPFRQVWWKPFSADGKWLLMDKRPDVNGYETYTIFVRALEDLDGQWRQIAADVGFVLWNTDWTEMAFNSDEIVTWQTFPNAEIIGQWNTGEFWSSPAAWSPDGQSIVTIGNIPGTYQYGLFLLKR